MARGDRPAGRPLAIRPGALAGLVAALAAALPVPAAAAPRRADLALTIGGGVSLGSYSPTIGVQLRF